ncbi:MAG: type II toxin-antitoxin system VapC family toxin [Gemmatimonas sp.]|nr:type II toxin-antitoxin system VapC family toxin [Gemmatimonas sp.]
MKRYLLDTNIVSVLASPQPDPRVVTWIRAQAPLTLHISVLVLGEIEKGVSRLPAGARKSALATWMEFELPGYFSNRIMPFDLACSRHWGRLDAEGYAIGRPLPVIDGLMLATAARHELVFVTRNVRDCAQRGVPVFDPYTGTLHEGGRA